MGDGRLGEVAELVVGEFGADADRVVGVRLQSADLVHCVRAHLHADHTRPYDTRYEMLF